MSLLHCARNSTILAGSSLEDCIIIIFTLQGFIGRHYNNLKSIDRIKFFLGGEACARHASKPLVHAEKILKCDCRIRPRFLMYAHTLFCLNRLMQTLRPTSPGLHPSGKFIHDNDLIVTYDILLVLMEKGFRAHRRLEMVRVFYPSFRVNIFKTKCNFSFVHS